MTDRIKAIMKILIINRAYYEQKLPGTIRFYFQRWRQRIRVTVLITVDYKFNITNYYKLCIKVIIFICFLLYFVVSYRTRFFLFFHCIIIIE